MAPLVKELESRAEIQSICCITAQHRQMLDDVLQLFAIQPDYDLDIMEARQSLYTITSKCLLGMEEVFSREKPDLVLVHGDTSTTFSGALAAFYQKIAVGHVEAGLRTWDKYSPFPEEMNRTLVGDLAEFHFCPTQANRENLLREGLREGIFVTGNTVIDALKTTVRPDYRFRSQLLNTLDNGSSQPSGLHRPKDHPCDLPPAGELWAAHDQYHAGPPPDRGGFPPSGACLSGASVPGGAGGGPGPPVRPRQNPFDRTPYPG